MTFIIEPIYAQLIIAALILIFISQIVIICIGFYKNHLLRIDQALQKITQAQREKMINKRTSSLKRK